jgi:predicted nucleotidyltransferase component of viral defense system
LEASKPRILKLDISDTEVVSMVEQRTILDAVWSDLPDAVPFTVYSVDEIAAEKLRCSSNVCNVEIYTTSSDS